MIYLLLIFNLFINSQNESSNQVLKEYYKNGNISKITLIEDNKIAKETFFRKHHFYQNGEAMIKKQIIYNSTNSYILIEYNLLGDIKSKSEFQTGLRHGLYIKYNSLKEIKEKVTYINGKKEGEEIVYNINGDVKRKTNYVNGKKHGYELKINLFGKITQENQYENGILVD